MKEKFYLEEIAFKSRAKLIGESISINGFSIDTRSLVAGNLYIALKGKNFDGHNFLEEARSKGAAALVVDKFVEIDLPLLVVEDTNNFLKSLAISNRNNFHGTVIGITGSNGKSSTKEILASLLSTKKSCHQTLGNKNNQIGMPLSMSNLTNNYNCSILELGTSYQGEISILRDISRPDISLITNAHVSHLSGLGSVDLVAEEKGCIADFCHDEGVLILLRESNYYQYWKKKTNASKVISFGMHPDSDFQIYNIEVHLPSNKTTFYLKTKKLNLLCELNGVGDHNALNAAGALAICDSMDVDLEAIIPNLKEIKFPERRLAVFPLRNNSYVIDDSYNSNPESMKRSIDLLDQVNFPTKILVAGEMGELGVKSANFHLEIAEYAKNKIEYLLCVGDLWKRGVNLFGNGAILFNSKEELIKYLSSIKKTDTVIMVKGSRSSRMDEVSDILIN